MDAADLERYLHTHIPISRAMGISVVAASAERVGLRAAITPNLNHRQTAFGGSVASLAVLAGWSLLRLGLDSFSPTPQIVIQRTSTEYAAPVTMDFEASCTRPADERWQRFLQAFTRRGRGRLKLAVDVRCADIIVAHLIGDYVALRES